VIVKVQRPQIRQIILQDLTIMEYLAHLLARRIPELGRYDPIGLVEEFRKTILQELDFRREGRNADRLRRHLQEMPGIVIPQVFWEYSAPRVLTIEYMVGQGLREAVSRSNEERHRIAANLYKAFLKQIFEDGFFHADPHPGNVFVMADGTLGLIDFGAIGRLDPIQRAAVIDMMAGFVRQDVNLVRDGIERVADMSGAVSSDRLERAIAHLMARNLRPSGTVGVGALQELVPMLTEFGIRLPGDLVLLSRALVTLDGTLGVLSPGRSIVGAALELAAPSGEPPVVDTDALLRDELASVLPRLRRLPDRFDRVMTLAARGDLRVRHVVDEDSGRILRTLVNRALLVAAGAAFVVASAILLGAAEDGPTVAGRTGLFEILGYGGLFTGSVLLLRVVAAVARDGTT
jgi:ubiquinone biosynthesis protein